MGVHRKATRKLRTVSLGWVMTCAALSVLIPVSNMDTSAASASVRYRVIPIALRSATSSPTAINSSGEVIGQIGASNPVPFVYRSGWLVRLIPPQGVVDAQALALNDAGTIAVQSEGPDGSLAFAVRRNGRGFHWIRLAIAGLNATSVWVSGVAGNGDIAGTVMCKSSSGPIEQRSVIWRPIRGGQYAVAQALPVSRGFNSTISGAIWRKGKRTYVAGAESASAPYVQDASVWSPAPEIEALPNQQLFVAAMGGARNAVYAAGTMRSATFKGWIAPVKFSPDGRAWLGRVDTLAPVPGYDQSVALGVSVTRGGLPVTVGDALSSASFATAGALWTGSSSASLLQSHLAGAQWTITSASGINARGDIAAAGIYRGSLQALLLIPER